MEAVPFTRDVSGFVRPPSGFAAPPLLDTVPARGNIVIVAIPLRSRARHRVGQRLAPLRVAALTRGGHSLDRILRTASPNHGAGFGEARRAACAGSVRRTNLLKLIYPVGAATAIPVSDSTAILLLSDRSAPQ